MSTKAEELAEYLELLASIADAGRPKMKDDKRRISAAELRRLAEIERQYLALKASIGEPVAEWVNFESGFQALVPTKSLQDGTHLYAIKDKS